MVSSIDILWAVSPLSGKIQIKNGELVSGAFIQNRGTFKNGDFSCPDTKSSRLKLHIDAKKISVGVSPTIVSVHSKANSFSFFLRDVNTEFPIYIPVYNVIVTTSEDSRNFAEIKTFIQAKGLFTKYQFIDIEPEETYENAAAHTRKLESPIWMGISRDMRIFEMGLRHPMHITDYIQPRFHGRAYYDRELTRDMNDIGKDEYGLYRYGFVAGRGWLCTDKVTRKIEDDTLPIFHIERVDDDIKYHHVAFVKLEQTPLKAESIRGTHWLVVDKFSYACSLTEEQEKAAQALIKKELDHEKEETVLCCRITATNTAKVPRYAFFKTVHPIYGVYGSPADHKFDGLTGFSMHENSDDVFAVSRLNGKAMPQQEISILVQPGEIAIYEFFLPHRPISAERACLLAKADVIKSLNECKTFWKNKLASAAEINIPEKRIDSMLKAGLLHLDLTTYGIEPDKTLVVTDGVYGPVALEIWKILFFFDSMGWHEIVKRSLMCFFEKQHKNGFIQCYEGYMGDTGGVLFAFGEHYRYTRDDQWVIQIKPKVIKCCQCIMDWRRRNLREDLRGCGYGMLDGKVADPNDNERIYKLNSYAYIGLSRAAEMLATVDPAESRRIKEYAEDFKADIRTSLFESLAKAPVIPLADGSWCPTVSPWASATGAMCLFTEDKLVWSHGTIPSRDGTMGTQLISQEIVEPSEQTAELMLNSVNELTFSRNVAPSQPCCSRHPYIHLLRGETKRFLTSYYNCLASLADREIYTWWEHFFHVSPHKTHEEADFLMNTRWMLYMEHGTTLKLLTGVPRLWLEDGKIIEIKNACSYFGKLSFSINSKVNNGTIEAEVVCNTDRKPDKIEIRIPHPENKKAKSVDHGVYNHVTETVVIDDFQGQVRIKLSFD